MKLIHARVLLVHSEPLGSRRAGSTMTKADNRVAFNHKTYYGLIIVVSVLLIFVYSLDDLNNIKGPLRCLLKIKQS